MTPEGCPGPILGRLARVAPELYAAVLAATAGAVPPRIAETLAQYMELQETRALLNGLRTQGRTRIVLLGFSPLVQELLKLGELDDFDLVGLHTDAPPREFYGFAKAYLRCEPLDSYTAKPEVAEIVAEPGLLERFPHAHHLPVRIRERKGNVFDAAAREAYPELFTPAREAALQAIHAVFEPGKTVLFAGVYTYFNFSRYSLALRKNGWKTVYLCLNSSNTAFRHGHFDAVVHAAGDIELFYALQEAVPWTCVHFQAWLGLHVFAAAAAMLNPDRTIVEFNDLPPYILTEKSFDATFGAGTYRRELQAIRTIMANSKATVFNLAPGGAEPLLRETPARGPVRYFHTYPCPDFFTAPAVFATPGQGPVRLAFAGSLSPSTLPHTVFGDVKLFGLIQELTAQGLEFHVFLNPYQPSDPRGQFWEYFHLAEGNPLFGIHPGVAPELLPRRLAALAHYGSMLYRFPPQFEILNRHFESMVPTKFFSYLEAGLPVLVNREFSGVCALVEEHGLGLCVDQEDIPRLAGLLRGVDHAALCANVARYRERNSMEAHIGELEALFTGAP